MKSELRLSPAKFSLYQLGFSVPNKLQGECAMQKTNLWPCSALFSYFSLAELIKQSVQNKENRQVATRIYAKIADFTQLKQRAFFYKKKLLYTCDKSGPSSPNNRALIKVHIVATLLEETCTIT